MKLTERDIALLDVACRHRLVTVDVTQELFFRDGTSEGARSLLRRLEGAEFLSRHLFTRREPYYQPAERAFALFGDAESKARPIGAQTLPRLLGVLLFASHCPTPAVRLRASELFRMCPELRADHPALTGIHDYVRIGGIEGEVTRVVVDLGGDHRAFAFKLRRSMREMLAEDAFRRLKGEKRLTLTLVCSSEAKRAAVQRALVRHATELPTRFVVVTHLFEVLSGQHVARTERET